MKFLEGETYVILEPVYSFQQGDKFVFKDGLLHGPGDLTLGPKLFAGRKGKFYIGWVSS